MPKASIPRRLASAFCLLLPSLSPSLSANAADMAADERSFIHVPAAKPLDMASHLSVEPAAGPSGGSISHFEIPGLVIHVDHGRDPLASRIDRRLLDRRDIRHQTNLLERAVEQQQATGDPLLTAKLTEIYEALAGLALLLDDADAARLSQERALDLFDVPGIDERKGRVMAIARLRTLDHWGDLSFRLGDFETASLAYREIAETTIAIGEDDGAVETPWPRVARTLVKLGASRREMGDRSGALEAFEAAGFVTRTLLSDARTLPASHRPLSMQLSFIQGRIEEIGGEIRPTEDIAPHVLPISDEA